jgi:hypothetical protein
MRLYMKAIVSCVLIAVVLFTVDLHGDGCIAPPGGGEAMSPGSTFIYNFSGNWTQERKNAVISALNEWMAAYQANHLYITYVPCQGAQCAAANMTLAMTDLPNGLEPNRALEGNKC